MSFIQQFFTSRDNNANAETFVGQQGRLWWDPVTNKIYSSDGSTPGGTPLAGGGGGNASPGGNTSQVQFNQNNTFDASPNFTFDTDTNQLAVIGTISASGNIISSGNVSGNYILGNGALLTGVITSVANINNGTSNVTVVSTDGNVSVSVGGTSNVAVFATTGEYITGLLSVSGNITGGNIDGGAVSVAANITGGNVLTGGLISATGNISGGNLSGTSIVGTLTTAAQTNITSVGTLTSVSVSGNVTGGNYSTAGLISATGNITGGNVNTATVNSTGTLTITSGSNGNISIQPNGAGNIILANTYINSVRYPVQDQDAASKIYVDNLVSTSISYHNAVMVATTTSLATTTSGSITYAQPNGAGNGIGATLTTTGSFNLIDTANVQTANTRILVKNEANAAHNGVYAWSNATVITRSSDADTYGVGDAFKLGLNDYFFTTSGDVNRGTAFVVDAPTGTITFGTSNIEFAIFSQAQTYSANTSAGLILNGTEFNAKVDNNTTAFDGSGNIIVKASANLTTPNIGVATGTSLSVTGNIVGGNVISGGARAYKWTTQANTAPSNAVPGDNWYDSYADKLYLYINDGTGDQWVDQSSPATFESLNVIGTTASGNLITTGQVSAAGNVTGNYVLGNGALLTGVITSVANINSGTSNVTVVSSGGNITVGVGGTANVVQFATTGAFVTGVVSATGNVSGGNLNVTGNIVDTGALTIITGASGNVTLAPNGTGVVVATTTGANITGTLNATGNGIIAGRDLMVGGAFNGFSTSSRGTIALNGTNSTLFEMAIANVTGGYMYHSGTDMYLWQSRAAILAFATNNTQRFAIDSAGAFSGAGNITGGNIIGTTAVRTTGLISATGNITSGNILTAGLISATGNITGGNVLGGANVNATTHTGTTVSITGNINSGNLITGAGSGGNITGANVISANTVTATANVTGGNVFTGGLISATGNVTGNYFIGNGALLTNQPTAAAVGYSLIFGG